MRLRPAIAFLLVLSLTTSVVAPSHAAPSRQTSWWDSVLYDINDFWAAQFADAGIPYTPPRYSFIASTVRTGCNSAMGTDEPGMYCPLDSVVYLSLPWGEDEVASGNAFGWVVVVAHEWGHHIQHLLAVPPSLGPDFELQADCLAGAFSKDAESRGLLGPGDMAKAIHVSAQGGDPPSVPNDFPDAHGNGAERMAALMTGYSKGVAGCGLPWPQLATSTPVPTRVPIPVVAPTPTFVPTVVPTLVPTPVAVVVPPPGVVPAAISLPQGQLFRVEQQGAEAPDPGLAQFGLTSGEFRIFASDNPPPGAAGWVEIHRLHFGSVAGASQALAYLAQGRMSSKGLAPLGPAGVGDESQAMSGPAYNGTEYTVFVRSGADLLRVTGISPSGVPSQDVIAAALQALAG